jgi:LysM repeat protein
VTASVTPTSAGDEGEPVPSDESVVATAKAEATSAAGTATAQATEGAGEPTAPDGTQEATEPEPEEPSEDPEATAVDEQPTDTPAEPTAALASTPTGSGIHTVLAGENLFRIALRYGVTVDALAAANGISDPGQIYVGQKLIIPTGGTGEQPEAPPAGSTTHVVKAGENLFRIAQRYGLTTDQLAAYNGISNPDQIYVGQVLQIPPQ